MSTSVTGLTETIDLLGAAPGVVTHGLGAVEERGGQRWAWAMGPEFFINGSGSPENGWKITFHFQLPKAEMCVEIFWNDTAVKSLRSPSDNFSIAGEFYLPKCDDVWEVKFSSSCWNSVDCCVSEADQRPLAFLIKELAFYDQGALTGRICPYPFSRMESHGTKFVPCCESWLKKSFKDLETGPDPWNGPAAQALRNSMYEGSFKYCHTELCGVELLPMATLETCGNLTGELPISPENIEAALKKKVILPEGPSAITVMGDPRCNLSCGSCRVQPIKKTDPVIDFASATTDRLLAVHAKSLKIIKFAGDGEAFFSSGLRNAIQRITVDQFPILEKVDVLTNGTLFDSEALKVLRPGSDFIRSVNVSIDAGDKATYTLVRGGNWERLRSNLSWISTQRQRERFSFFGLTFAMQARNFRSFPAFMQMAEELRVDEVYVGQLLDWSRMAINFNAEAVHLDSHPEYDVFREMWNTERAISRTFLLRTNLS